MNIWGLNLQSKRIAFQKKKLLPKTQHTPKVINHILKNNNKLTSTFIHSYFINQRNKKKELEFKNQTNSNLSKLM